MEKRKPNPLILKFRQEATEAMQLHVLTVATVVLMNGNEVVGYEVRTIHIRAENLEAAYDMAIKQGYTPIH